ncbi:hypothetical protein SEA_TRIUMPH_82 [Streptomyces phage Triumph]|nr:hypothetical protein SEA_TRIUMPH_82 [Streptomyces phage Triumph]
MVSLDKTPHSIQYGRVRAKILAGVRRNDLRHLALEFGEQAHQAEVKRFEAHKAKVLGN